MMRARFRPTALIVAAALTLTAATAAGAVRTSGSKERRPASTTMPPGVGMTIFRTSNAQALANCLLGSGFTVTGTTLTAAAAAAGGFTAGSGVVGLDAGVVLSTGDVDSLARVNQFNDMSTINGTPGDPALDALLDPASGIVSYDAAVLVIDFTAATPGTLNLSFAFGSEEYNEFVNDVFNDIFAIFLDGDAAANNIALTGGACATSPGLAVAINSVNCGIDGTNTSAPNCPCYRDNAGATIETELDGLTKIFTASAPVSAGPHRIKIAIADAADEVWDAAVFIKCQSGEVPTLPSTWGNVKVRYR